MIDGIGPAVLFLLAGGGFGLIYMGVLWGAVRILASGGRAWIFAAMGLLRAGLLVAALWLAVESGATAVDLAFAVPGFIAIRLLAARYAKTTDTECGSWK